MDSPSVIKEDLIQYVWKSKLFDINDLITTCGLKVSILNFGVHNHDSGPDFLNAKVMIDGILWAGNVEMHVTSSDWNAHKHSADLAYDNVILHVVYEHDTEILRKDNTRIPCIELKSRIPNKLKSNYLTLINNTSWIPCEGSIQKTSLSKHKLMYYNLLVERLERKTKEIKTILDQENNDWEQVSFILLSKYLGSRVNKLPMEMVARSIPFQILLKNINRPFILEAILIGQAGLLTSGFKDEYPKKLKKEYLFQKEKYNLKPINPIMWKMSRLRPANFPLIRLAQLSKIIETNGSLFRMLIDTKNVTRILELFNAIASEYWDTHYRIDVESKYKEKALGKSFAEMICINVVAPILFLYGKEMSDDRYISQSITLLEAIPPENNTIIKKWNSLGLLVENGFASQALIQLKNEYCNKFRCLSCRIGNEIINQ